MKSVYLLIFILLINVLNAQDKKQAEIYFLDGNYSSALSEYELLIADDKQNVEFNFNLALCYLNTNGDKSRAIPYLENLVVNPKIIPDAWYLLGRAYHFGYQFDNAIRAYNKFIENGKGLTADFGYNTRIIGKWQADLNVHAQKKDRLSFTERTRRLSTGIRYFPSDNLRFLMSNHQTHE